VVLDDPLLTKLRVTVFEDENPMEKGVLKDREEIEQRERV
jgi:hypothetical protein